MSTVRSLAIIAALMMLFGCREHDQSAATPIDAQGETPVRYVICNPNGLNCFIAARFNNFSGCESHQRWSSMQCDRNPGRGSMVCNDTRPEDNLTTSFCTK